MPAPKKYPVELRDRSIRLVEDLLSDPDLGLSVTGACNREAEQPGINRDRLRGWVKQAQIDASTKPGCRLTSAGVGLTRGQRCSSVRSSCAPSGRRAS